MPTAWRRLCSAASRSGRFASEFELVGKTDQQFGQPVGRLVRQEFACPVYDGVLEVADASLAEPIEIGIDRALIGVAPNIQDRSVCRLMLPVVFGVLRHSSIPVKARL